MEDSVPILTKSDSIEQEKLIPSSDEMIEKGLGRFGWVEFVQCILVSFAMFFDAQQSFISIYSDDYPTWHCNDFTTCSTSSDICKLPKSSWTWDGPSSKTIISQWGLECASSFITGLPQSSFFIGCLLGSFLLATLADTSLGRKNMLILSCLSMSITSIVIVFSTNVWVYSAFKFLIGFWRSSIGTCVLVLLTEKVSTEWRFTVGIVEYFCFTLGYMSLPGIAYVNRNSSWKTLYVWTSIPAIVYSIIAYIFVTESPRWLLMQGRQQEAMAMLKGVSSVESGADDLTASLLKATPKQKASIFQLYSSIAEIFERSWALKRMIEIMVLGIGIGMVYFGMPLAVGNLGFDIYLAVVFNALMEIPSCVATYFLENCRRRPSILVFSIASGICSIMSVVVGNWLQGVKVGLSLISFFSACTAYNVFLIYIIELFPTSVRNTTTSLVRQAIVFGNIFSPFLISAGRKNDFFSYGVFGIVIISSCITLLGLPETKGIALCDTMDQQEKKENTSV
ncbi:MFS transporter superfamily [Sesbania bispinosa]|nr:MFS transporter superfamily [Sesbania bispinosa]